MRFPPWYEFTEKISNLEEDVRNKIKSFQNNHDFGGQKTNVVKGASVIVIRW